MIEKIEKKVLTLPTELYQREFYLNLYMALIAANKGYQIIIGEQNDLAFKKISNGVFIHKDHANWSEKLYRNAKKRNMKTVAFDVEGLIYNNSDTYINNRACKWIIENIDIVFLWGEKQKGLLSRVTEKKDNFYVVGSPKFDLCNLVMKHNQVKKNIKATKILINTRFASTNNIRKSGDIQNLSDLGLFKSKQDLEDYHKFLESEQVIFDEFLTLIKLLNDDGGFIITIRTHPAEDEEIYNRLSPSHKNVKVDRITDLRKQIIDHDCLIHDSCTTAIEALAIGKPVFGLRPEGLKNSYPEYANQYSLNFSAATDLHLYLNNNNISEFTQPNIDDIALKSIHNWKNKSRNATYEMINIIDTLDIKKQKIFNQNFLSSFDIKAALFDLLNNNRILSKVAKFFLKKKVEKFIFGRETLPIKYPNLSLKVVENFIKELNKLDKNTALLKEVKIKKLSNKTLLIYKEK